MPQKFLHLNCFFPCGITASSLTTFDSIAFTVGGWTGAPVISASLVRASQSLIAFASGQFLDLDLIIALYCANSGPTEATPYQKLAWRRICMRGPTVSAGGRWGAGRRGPCDHPRAAA